MEDSPTTEPQNTDPLVDTLDAAATRLGIGRSLLYRLIASDHIQSIKVGKRRLIARAEQMAFLSRRTA